MFVSFLGGLITFVELHPYVNNSFLGYFIPTTLLPTKSHIVNAKLVKTPAIAPFELQNGKNIPRQ
jgi:hypothetical protein